MRRRNDQRAPHPARAPLPSAAALAAVVLALALATVVAGCGTVTSPLPPPARPLPGTSPAGAAASPGPGAPAGPCQATTASWRPPAVLPAPGQAAGPTLATVLRRGYLTVGVRPDTPPFGSINPDTGQFEGFDVDVAALIGRALFGADGRVKFRAVTAAQRIDLVQRGQLDLVAATVSVTCERAEKVDFSEPYFLTTSGVLVRRGSPYRGLGDLGGRRVCAAAGTTSLRQIETAPSHPIPHAVTNVTECLVALQDGTDEGVVNDETVLLGMAAQDPKTHIVGRGPRTTQMGVVVSRAAPDLTRFVNAVLQDAKRNGAWSAIYQHWLHAPAPAPPAPTYRD
ncbi:glutamate ABC transporter substrate-binding protein [Frankia sp. QA3]|uniref:glutamate ABC transporter substrate-binding protein n=1 Tax=Frankia sp. QA3 TaxID=710111 RepID=UPI0002E547EA|nr:glutamate ABC transporter substrate-binding protein [Frankia sp. QA3]